MLICGLKLTHDGAVAIIQDNQLIHCIEMEKRDNNKRFTEIKDLKEVEKILDSVGLQLSDVDVFAVDGWGGNNAEQLAQQPRLEIGASHNKITAWNYGEEFQLNVCQYEEANGGDPLQGEAFNGLKIGRHALSYSSYLHVADHIMGTYCTSPFAEAGQDSYILVWDGGMYPRFYYFDYCNKQIEPLGPLFLLIGNIYTIFSQFFGPFKVGGTFAKDSLSVAGKVMAYIAKGELKEELFSIFEEIYKKQYTMPMGFANVFANLFKEKVKGKGYRDEDILCTFHVYIERLLIEKLAQKIKRYPRQTKNLCISGGCGLNIKWNSAIRESNLFEQVYVPPFPNDSGSAVGAACCAMFHQTGRLHLKWDVYSGPAIEQNDPADGWVTSQCSIKELAALLYNEQQPVVLLHGKSELGPRALGNRSVIAPAENKEMKETLNRIKKREDYRPISPICLADKAESVFIPGPPDPYMLFEHVIRDNWKEKIPAVMHLDGTARLQTVTKEQNALIHQLLSEYERLSGIPLLCNTSANYNGSGFFPDVHSATQWDRVNYIWCNDKLYQRKTKQEL
jgi:carbamoyltransferase